MQKLFALALVSTMAGAILAVPSAPAAAYSPEEQQACQPDAFRLCNHAIPDEARTRACMVANVNHLSPGCRRFFVKPRARRRH